MPLWPRFTNNGVLVYYFCAFCIKLSFGNFGVVIVIPNLRFLQRPQKRSRRNQFIHRRLTRTQSIGRGQLPDSQSGRHLDGYGGLCLDERRGGRRAEENKSGYPSGRQPSCHEWEDLEYGVLA